MMSVHKKIFVYSLLSEEDKTFLRNGLPEGASIRFRDELADATVEQEFAEADYVYGNPPAEWLRRKEIKLRWMQLYSTGFNEYQDLDGSIAVSNLHGYFAQPCAETVLAGILALYRKIDELTLLKARKEWTGGDMRPQMKLLQGQKVILLGTGTIAMAIAELLAAFHCDIKFYGRSYPGAAARNPGELLKILPGTDILISTLPGTKETHHFVSASLLETMDANAVFVNIGRGSTVDEEALIKALETRKIAGAVLDVFEEEPLPAGSRLWTCANTILTQHTGGGSAMEVRGKLSFFLKNLSLVMKGETPLNLVELKKGY